MPTVIADRLVEINRARPITVGRRTQRSAHVHIVESISHGQHNLCAEPYETVGLLAGDTSPRQAI